MKLTEAEMEEARRIAFAAMQEAMRRAEDPRNVEFYLARLGQHGAVNE